MFKKTITYEDYKGETRTEDFYFNLTKAELMEMELGTTGGYTEMVEAIVKAKDTPSLVKIFKEMILKSYGQKSADGRTFNKTPEITHEFVCTEAYSELFMELATSSTAGAEFFNGLIPASIAKQIKEQAAATPAIVQNI